MIKQDLIEIDGKWFPCEIETDESEYPEITPTPQEEIERLKSQLADTDYKAIKYAEGWYQEEEYAPIKAEREALRERIRELENTPIEEKVLEEEI